MDRKKKSLVVLDGEQLLTVERICLGQRAR